MQGSDCFNSLDAVATSFVLTRGDWESESIDHNVANGHLPVINQVSDEARSYGNFSLGCASLTLFIDGQSNNGRAMFPRQRHDFCKARVWPVSVFVIH